MTWINKCEFVAPVLTDSMFMWVYGGHGSFYNQTDFQLMAFGGFTFFTHLHIIYCNLVKTFHVFQRGFVWHCCSLLVFVCQGQRDEKQLKLSHIVHTRETVLLCLCLPLFQVWLHYRKYMKRIKLFQLTFLTLPSEKVFVIVIVRKVTAEEAVHVFIVWIGGLRIDSLMYSFEGSLR